MAAEQAYFDGTGLQELLHELPITLPEQLPHRRSETDEQLYTLLSSQVRRHNPYYGRSPADLQEPFTYWVDGEIPTSIADSETYVKAKSIFRIGHTGILLASLAGFINTAPEDAEECDFKFVESDSMLVNVPLPRFGNLASLTAFLRARSVHEEQDSIEGTYSTSAGWELRMPVPREVAAFGSSVDSVLIEKTVLSSYFAEGTEGIIVDQPVYRSTAGFSRPMQLSNHTTGIIKGAHFDEHSAREVVGVGAVILEAFQDRAFKPLVSNLES